MPHFTTSDGLELFYEDSGEGLPILCLPGLTRTTADFEYVTPHLAGNRLIKLDYRGRGQSAFDPIWQNYTIAVESRDVLELLAHLSVSKTAILGTSRGGMIAMGLAAMAKEVLLGVALNDIGPELDPKGLEFIMVYLGRNPAAKTHAEAAGALKHVFAEFKGVPDARWLREAEKNFTQTPQGLQITYDPKLRDAVELGRDQPLPDLWPFFDALSGLPLATLRGANSGLLTADTLTEMQKRRPDMITGIIPDRGHVPFLDEAEAIETLQTWVEKMQ
ncbi:MAG: alpha/beta hydrolase [Sulfitobacter sp.]